VAEIEAVNQVAIIKTIFFIQFVSLWNSPPSLEKKHRDPQKFAPPHGLDCHRQKIVQHLDISGQKDSKSGSDLNISQQRTTSIASDGDREDWKGNKEEEKYGAHADASTRQFYAINEPANSTLLTPRESRVSQISGAVVAATAGTEGWQNQSGS
jgi:hypothetical protein